VIDLTAERLNQGLSLTAAAEKIGVPSNVLSRAESNEGRPHPANAKRIADFYGFKVTDIWPVDNGTKAAA
jgi:transcriptional regulator with XRE-family HTH domain